MTSVREPRPRARRHQVTAVVVAAYLAAAGLVVATSDGGNDARWLALHLLGLGAATNAVMVWSRHFSQAVLHARLRSERAAHVRLALLNGGVVAVLSGVEAGSAPAAGAGAVVIVAAVAWHVASLGSLIHTFRLPGPLRSVSWFYVASGLCLVSGATIGGVMAGALVADDGVAQRRLHLVHAQLNLLGWIGLAVLGTQVVMWPAVLRTRMSERAPAVAPWTLAGCVTGLLLLTVGTSIGERSLAVAGCAAYGVGVLLAVERLVRTLRRRLPTGLAPWSLALATGWLLAAVVVDAVRLAASTDPDRVLHPVVPMLAVGLVAQVLVGAMTFLLPVTIGGGPVGNRRLAAVLERGAAARVVLANVGLLVAVVPAPRAVYIAGWAAVLSGLGAFLPLLAVALAGGRTRPDPGLLH